MLVMTHYSECSRKKKKWPRMRITLVEDKQAQIIIRADQVIRELPPFQPPHILIKGPGWQSELVEPWSAEVLDRGKVFGDERWILGQNSDEEIVVLHFDR
jgi:hypothetical protein